MRSNSSASPSTRSPVTAPCVVEEQPLDRGADADAGAGVGRPAGDRLDQPVVSAREAAHRLAGPTLRAGAAHPPRPRPEIGRRKLVVVAVEARIEQRAPHLLDDGSPAVPTQPRFERHVLELLAVAPQLALGDEPGEPRALQR